jgi:hypothetical protein
LTRDAPHGWDRYPGLRFPGHTSGNRGKGRIQIAVKRAFAAASTTTLTTSDVFDYALARHRDDGWRRQQRWSVVRVLRAMCDPIGRDPRHGAIIWRSRDGSSATVSPESARSAKMVLILAAVWLLLDFPWGLLAFVALAVLYGLR